MLLIEPQAGSRSLPGPGIYRFAGNGADICMCLVGLEDMLRQFFPTVDPADYRTRPARRLDADFFQGEFLSGDEIRQANCFKALKKQVEWIGGRHALKTLAMQTLPGAAHARQVIVAYEPRGAPYLVGHSGISISISHAGDYAVAGICRDTDTRLGLDIECIASEVRADVMRVAFTDSERAAAGGSPERVCRIWTRKEAYLKFIKTGFRESLKRVDVSAGPIVHGGVPVAGLGIETLRVGGAYCLSIVYGHY